MITAAVDPLLALVADLKWLNTMRYSNGVKELGVKVGTRIVKTMKPKHTNKQVHKAETYLHCVYVAWDKSVSKSLHATISV